MSMTRADCLHDTIENILDGNIDEKTYIQLLKHLNLLLDIANGDESNIRTYDD